MVERVPSLIGEDGRLRTATGPQWQAEQSQLSLECCSLVTRWVPYDQALNRSRYAAVSQREIHTVE
jgi:hypothetical protein